MTKGVGKEYILVNEDFTEIFQRKVKQKIKKWRKIKMKNFVKEIEYNPNTVTIIRDIPVWENGLWVANKTEISDVPVLFNAEDAAKVAAKKFRLSF